MDKYFEQFEQTVESYGYKDLKGVSREVKLLALYGYYNFYRADSSFLDDLFNSSIIYESGSEDHIDGIFMDSEADEETVELVSSYYVLPTADFININDKN